MPSPPSRFPTLVHHRTCPATTYYFRPVDDLGWALATVNDATSELSIVSDWGNWSYRWGGHFGDSTPTLTDFIANRSLDGCRYLADKLWGNGYGGREFSPELTIKKWRSELAKRRLEQGREHRQIAINEYGRDLRHMRGPAIDVMDAGACHDRSEKREYWHGITNSKEPLTASIARSIWDEFGSLSDISNQELFLERFYRMQGYKWVHDHEEPWDETESEQDHMYGVLLNSILPALVIECTRTALQRSTGAPCMAPLTLKPNVVW